MYASKIKNHQEPLTFQVSGKLWQRSLVMRDKQTGSLWAHLLGECMEGPLKGSILMPIPAVVTSWKDWKKSHPATTVLFLKRSSKKFNMEDLYQKPEKHVIGIEHNGITRAWPFNVLLKKTVYPDQIGTEKIVVAFLKDSATGFIFKRSSLEFLPQLKDGNLISKDGTVWDLWQAKAISGPKKGQLLERLHAIPSYHRSWIKFHPKSSIAQ